MRNPLTLAAAAAAATFAALPVWAQTAATTAADTAAPAVAAAARQPEGAAHVDFYEVRVGDCGLGCAGRRLACVGHYFSISIACDPRLADTAERE